MSNLASDTLPKTRRRKLPRGYELVRTQHLPTCHEITAKALKDAELPSFEWIGRGNLLILVNESGVHHLFVIHHILVVAPV
jgi:hypothetical protein